MSGCLPMLIQMPVFIGFYTMLRSAIELRGAHFLWVADLSKPDTLFMIPGLTSRSSARRRVCRSTCCRC